MQIFRNEKLGLELNVTDDGYVLKNLNASLESKLLRLSPEAEVWLDKCCREAFNAAQFDSDVAEQDE